MAETDMDELELERAIEVINEAVERAGIDSGIVAPALIVRAMQLLEENFCPCCLPNRLAGLKQMVSDALDEALLAIDPNDVRH
jgi:hypothetical protein